MVKHYMIYVSADALSSKAYTYSQAGDTDNAFANQTDGSLAHGAFKTLGFPNNSVNAMRSWLLLNVFQGFTTQPALSNPQVFTFQGRTPKLQRLGSKIGILANGTTLVSNVNIYIPNWSTLGNKLPMILTHLNDLTESKWQYGSGLTRIRKSSNKTGTRVRRPFLFDGTKPNGKRVTSE